MQHVGVHGKRAGLFQGENAGKAKLGGLRAWGSRL